MCLVVMCNSCLSLSQCQNSLIVTAFFLISLICILIVQSIMRVRVTWYQFLQLNFFFVFIWDQMTTPMHIKISENAKMKLISMFVDMRMLKFFIFPKPRFVA